MGNNSQNYQEITGNNNDNINETSLSSQISQQIADLSQTQYRLPITLRRRDNPTELEEAVKQVKRALSTLENCINNSKEEDECDLYGKIFAKKLRKLPDNEREIFMYEINGMFVNRLLHCNNQSLTSYTALSFTPQVSCEPKSAVEINVPKRPSSSSSSYSEPVKRISSRPSIPHCSTSEYSAKFGRGASRRASKSVEGP